jgi:hypothetical protein
MVHVLVEPELTAVRFLYGRSRKFDRRIRRIEIEIPPAAYEGLCFLDDVFKAMLACLELYLICRRVRQA